MMDAIFCAFPRILAWYFYLCAQNKILLFSLAVAQNCAGHR